MLSRLVCRRNSGAKGSRKVASSGKGWGEAFGTRVLFMFPLYHKTNKVVLGGGLKDAGWNGEHLVASQLAILPGATHYNIHFRADLLLPVLAPFLNKLEPAIG